MTTFNALVADKKKENITVDIKRLTVDDLPKGDVLIKVKYSSVNYKDGLATIPNGNVVKSYPMVPGIDLAGIVASSTDSRFKEGDSVIVTSYDLGVAHYGGFSEYARVPADWVVPLPEAGLSLKEAMIFGTAGFTAALSIHRLEENGLMPSKGSVLVTGATGGVGSLAVAMLNQRGYNVIASSGKAEEHKYLKTLGAKEIISREEVSPEKIRVLDSQKWAGVIDPVGGRTLSYILSTTKYGGSVAVSGMTGGVNVETSVFPFILRGINLLGIDSAYCPMDMRMQLWDRLSDDLKPTELLDQISHQITLEQLPGVLENILKAKVRGRTIVSF